MYRNGRLLVLVFIFVFGTFALAADKGLVREGLVLSGVDGKVVMRDKDSYVFEFSPGLKDARDKISAGTSMELLPSGTLEKMAADINDANDAGFRLWGTVTRYGGDNFLFPTYFLRIREVQAVADKEPDAVVSERRPAINEPNDELAVPQEILRRINKRRIVRTQQLEKPLELKQDAILADRTGFFVQQADGSRAFVLDGLGRNIGKVSFKLLACQPLEWAEQKQAGRFERLRFKVTGIVTEYKGGHYLLLQRARRVYSHGNFAR